MHIYTRVPLSSIAKGHRDLEEQHLLNNPLEKQHDEVTLILTPCVPSKVFDSWSGGTVSGGGSGRRV